MSSLKRTNAEIEAEIKELERVKTFVPKRTIFGENNESYIDAQLETLKAKRDISDKFLDDDDENDEQRDYNASRGAFSWMIGETDDRPSEGWESFDPQSKGGESK